MVAFGCKLANYNPVKPLLMNRVNPKKLLGSKWTAVRPQNKEKHFMIIDVEFDEESNVTQTIIQAVFTKREFEIAWHELKLTDTWLIGWK